MNTDITLHLGSPNDNVEIGCSKPINQLSIEDFTSGVFNVGAIDNRVEVSAIFGPNIPDIPFVGGHMESAVINDYTGLYKQTRTINATCGQNNRYHDGVYIRAVFLMTNRYSYQDSASNGFDITDVSTRVITSMDITKVHLVKTMTASDNTAVNDDTPDDKIIARTIPNIYYKTFNHFTETEYTGYYIVPAWIVVNNEYVTLWNGGMTSYVRYAGGTAGTLTAYKIFDGTDYFSAQPLLNAEEDIPVPNTTFNYDYGNKIDGYNVEWYRTSSSNVWNLAPRPNKLMYMYQCAWSGLYFKLTDNGKTYKPIIKKGIVTGFTDDLNVPSDIDNWTNINNHNIPDTPPTDDDSDITEKMDIGGMYTAGGMVNYYAISESATLDALSEHLSSWDYVETGKDVLRNLVSLKACPIPRDNLCHGFTKEIIIAGTHTDVTALSVDSTFDKLILGDIHIAPEYNDFRDYAPYTKLEINCPFVGWIELPSHCMNHDISVNMTYDIVTGSCKVFVILDNNTIVAEKSGVICFDIPFTAEAVGAKTAGLISGVLGVATSALGGVTSLATGNPVGVGASAIGIANSVTQLVATKNANYTQSVGNTGDANNFSGVKKCYLKITRPVSHEPDNYKHSVGYMYNNTHTLDEDLGYTTVKNPYIEGTMMESEKDMIKSLLVSGVIL